MCVYIGQNITFIEFKKKGDGEQGEEVNYRNTHHLLEGEPGALIIAVIQILELTI